MTTIGRNAQIIRTLETLLSSTPQDVDDIANRAREDDILSFEPAEYLPGAYMCGVKDPNGNCVEFSYGHLVPPITS